jgi:hypothetical protein
MFSLDGLEVEESNEKKQAALKKNLRILIWTVIFFGKDVKNLS